VQALAAAGHRDDDDGRHRAHLHQALRGFVDLPLGARSHGVEDVLTVVQVEHRVAPRRRGRVTRRQPDLHLAGVDMRRGLRREALDAAAAPRQHRGGGTAEGARQGLRAGAQQQALVGAGLPAFVGAAGPFDLELVGQLTAHCGHGVELQAHTPQTGCARGITLRRCTALPRQRRAPAAQAHGVVQRVEAAGGDLGAQVDQHIDGARRRQRWPSPHQPSQHGRQHTPRPAQDPGLHGRRCCHATGREVFTATGALQA